MTNPKDLSDEALILWFSFFLSPKSTLRFGGDGAKMEITPEARAALDELITFGAVQTVEPDDQIPNREHYGGTDVDLREEFASRPHLNPFTGDDRANFVTFRKKTDDRDPSVNISIASDPA